MTHTPTYNPTRFPNGIEAGFFLIDQEIQMTDTAYFYIGDANTDGSVRFANSTGDFTVESRINGTWTLIGAFVKPSGE